MKTDQETCGAVAKQRDQGGGVRLRLDCHLTPPHATHCFIDNGEHRQWWQWGDGIIVRSKACPEARDR